MHTPLRPPGQQPANVPLARSERADVPHRLRDTVFPLADGAVSLSHQVTPMTPVT